MKPSTISLIEKCYNIKVHRLEDEDNWELQEELAKYLAEQNDLNWTWLGKNAKFLYIMKAKGVLKFFEDKELI